MMRRLFAFALLVSMSVASAYSEEGTPPDALYAAAFHSQGLYFSGAKPWHVKASYTVFDAKGEAPVKGVFEEWWVGPHHYKLSYSRAGFMQTDYATATGLYRVGEQAWPTGQEIRIPTDLFDPLPDLQNMTDIVPQKAEFTGDAKLRCAALMPAASAKESFATYPLFCFEANAPVLRLSVPYGSHGETIYNRMQRFQGHYVAGELEVNVNDKMRLKLEVESLEGLGEASEPFVPPPDAKLLPTGPVPLSSGSLRLIRSVAPVYPILAKEKRVEGTVDLKLTIGRDGHVKDVRVLRGPKMLQQPAADAARQWIYNEFVLGGEPTEVEIENAIAFHLDH